MLSNGQLIATVLAFSVLELLALAVLAATGHRRTLMRQMLPGAAAALFLALALRELQTGGGWLALWLVCAGLAHAADWWQRARPA